MDNSKPKIIIEIDSGAVMNITSTTPLEDIVIIDHDEEQIGGVLSIDLISHDKFSEQIDIITNDWKK